MIDEEKEIIEESTPNVVEEKEVETPQVEVVDSPKEKGKKPKKKKSKLRSAIEWVITGIFGALFVVVLIGQIDGAVNRGKHYGEQIRLGFASYKVLTDSMEPEYPVGTAIITFLESEDKIIERFNNGETVDLTFKNNKYNAANCPERSNPLWNNPSNEVVSGMVMTHRLFEVLKDDNGVYYFVTSGINTLEPGDPEYSSSESYRRKEQYQILTYDQVLGVVKVNSPFLGGVFDVLSSPLGLLIFLLIPAGYMLVTSVIDIIKALKMADENEEQVKEEVKTSVALEGLSEKEKERLKKEMLEEMLNKSKGGKE